MKICRALPLLFGLVMVPVAGTCANQLTVENLLSATLEGTPGTEVLVSRVYIPSNTTLPKHWHPGEEFAYILDGSVTLWQQGKENVLVSQGEAIKVPLRQIHTAITGDTGVKLLIFRVHEQGKPQRVNVE